MREVHIGGTAMELHYGINAMADIEKELGGPVYDLLQRSGEKGLSIREILVVLWAGLKAKRRGMTLDQTAKLLDEAENIIPVAQACMEELAGSMARRFGGASEGEEEETGKN